MANEQEVKRDVEVITPSDDGSDAGVLEAGDDEIITPAAIEQGEDNASNQKQASGQDDVLDDQSDSSKDDDTAETTPGQNQTAVHSKKPVEGETTREKALRLEIERLKGERRQAAQDRIAGTARPPAQQIVADERMEKLKKVYSEDEIRNMEDAIDVIASSKGYVKQQDNYQASVNNVLESFLESHQEYKPEHDRDDLRWNRFQEILVSDYNLNGKTVKQVNQIFSKVHRDVAAELGEIQIPTRENKLNAQRQKIQSVSHTGGTGNSSKSGTKKLDGIDPKVRAHFKGFDDEDFA